MKKWWISIVSLLFFFIIQTAGIWEKDTGPYGFLIYMLLIIFLFILVIILLGQFVSGLMESFQNKHRNIQSLILLFVILSTIFFPFGFIRHSHSSAESIFYATREGGANCRTSVTLYDDSTFSINDVCFGHGMTVGKYRLSSDTVFFTELDTGRFGREAAFLVLENRHDFNVQLYKSIYDPEPLGLFLSQNQLDLKGSDHAMNDDNTENPCDFKYDTITNSKYRMHKHILDKFYHPTKRGYYYSGDDTVNTFVYHQDIAVFIGLLDPKEKEPYRSLTNKVIFLILENDAAMLNHGVPDLTQPRGAFKYFLQNIENPKCSTIPMDELIKMVKNEFETNSSKDIENKRLIIGSLHIARHRQENS